MLNRLLPVVTLTGLLAGSALAQHSQVSAVAVDPTDPARVWVCNRDNNSVSLLDTNSGSIVHEFEVGMNPRSLAIGPNGRVFVANQRGDVPLTDNGRTGYALGAQFGTVSVIDPGTLTVTTLTGVGVEPYGIAVAPNQKYFVVSGFRSGTIKAYDIATLQEVASHQYLRTLNEIPPGFTVADVDENRDGLADLGDPRGFVIRSDSQRIYVTHFKSPYISVLEVQLTPAGLPTGIVEAGKIDTNEYTVDPFFNPIPVTTVQSQGLPRFLEDIALSPDGTRALVPHVLHNINHDVNHDFAGAIAGDFENRVYPALTMLDMVSETFDQGFDNSNRLHNEVADPRKPAEFRTFGLDAYHPNSGNPVVLGLSGSPVIGGSLDLVVSGMEPGDSAIVRIGRERHTPAGSAGTSYVSPRVVLPVVNGTATFNIPNNPSSEGGIAVAQALITSALTGDQVLSSPVMFRLSANPLATNKMGHRAGQPSRALFSPDGQHALMLNRGSEDLFLYDISGSDMTLRQVFPPRLKFHERSPLSASSPMGDLPLGMALVPDASTDNDDAIVYVINEGNRTLSTLRVDWETGTIRKLKNQQRSILLPDAMTQSQLIGQELFEDASRPQTTGHFNNSCASCHFEGGADGNVWQRPAGPRSTMPVFGGTLGTGLILWKGVRLNMGETGPMFGGENGGTGDLTDEEQQGLTDYHEVIAPPLNPNRDPVTGGLTAQAAFGRDLFLGINDTGLNGALRHAGCSDCHSTEETSGQAPGIRFFTADFVFPQLSGGENLGVLDPDCFSLRENIVAPNIRNVNTGANIVIDIDGDTIPDTDRNFDGFDDTETYAIMNPDTNDDFHRDDVNSYMCPCDAINDPDCDAQNPIRLFTRKMTLFSIPTKLGVFATGPYFHDHAAFSLRALVDPVIQSVDPVYGDPAYGLPVGRPGLNKLFNDAHDVRGHQQFVPGVSKVQQTLQTPAGQEDADVEAILAFIRSL
ncbi:MAG: hypothetical protein H6831_11805 [Planctomycetes bacterium]|nr:hypothetical protein [Planctomycetota bacterium]MCB9905085.1 hypothetical protein [Planctomycetota bacterium]